MSARDWWRRYLGAMALARQAPSPCAARFFMAGARRALDEHFAAIERELWEALSS